MKQKRERTNPETQPLGNQYLENGVISYEVIIMLKLVADGFFPLFKPVVRNGEKLMLGLLLGSASQFHIGRQQKKMRF